MVVKDIDDKEKNYKLFIEEQIINNIKYSISYAYAPNMDLNTKRITLSKIDKDNFNNYEEIHGIDFSDNNIKSFYLIHDKDGSSHDGNFLDDNYEYYDEVILAFDNLIKEGKSEFTNKALIFLEEVKKIGINKRSYKNGI